MQWGLMMASGGLLAVIGSLTEAYHVKQGFDGVGWAFRSCATIVVMFFVMGVVFSLDRSAIGGWSIVVSALFVAGFFPFAVESVRFEVRADSALMATVFSVIAARRGEAVWCVMAGVAAGIACACDVTAFAWPVALVCAGLSGRKSHRASGLILLGGIIGLFAGRGYGWSVFSWPTIGGGLAGVHRDLTALLPLLFLGVVGFSSIRARLSQEGAFQSVLSSWTMVAMYLLFLAFVGAPLDLRLCVLPVMIWMPVALTELREMVASIGVGRHISRGVGYLSCGVVLCLLIPDVVRLMNGPLMALYLLSR